MAKHDHSQSPEVTVSRTTAELIADTQRTLDALTSFFGGSTLAKSQDALARMRADLREVRSRLDKLELQSLGSREAKLGEHLAKFRR